jgi:carbonic anhydrase
VVCGHSNCGAMRAALMRQPMPEAPNLAKWLHHATSAASRLEQEGPLDSQLTLHDQLSQVNVLVQLEHLMSYPLVREGVAAGTLHLSGWWYDVATGGMFAYEREIGRFGAIDRNSADRLMGRPNPPAR